MGSPRHYLDNETLTRNIANWVISAHNADAQGVERPAVPESIGLALLTLSQRVARKTYARHPMREDMASFAVVHALSVLDQFDPTQTNAFAWLTTLIHRECGRFVRQDETERDYALSWAREHHRGDVRVRKLLADPHTQQRLTHHDSRRAEISEKLRAVKPKKPRKPRKGDLTLPSGEVVTPNQLATRLGVVHHRVYRRLKAGRSVAEILDEFGPI